MKEVAETLEEWFEREKVDERECRHGVALAMASTQGR